MNRPSPRRPPRLTDVAEAAGVSVPTVSRVLNGTAAVSAERRERVERAVRELNFRPNAAAQSLVRGTRSLLAIMAANSSRYGYNMTIEGIEQEARRAGQAVIIGVVETEEPDAVHQALDHVLSQPVSGVIVLEFDPPGRAALEAIPSHVPVVGAAPAGRRDGAVRVLLDDREPARLATQHLLSLGHRTVHHVAIPPSNGRSRRADGWRSALRDAGVDVPDVLQADWTPRSGYEAGLVLADDPGVTAVLCGNDELAVGVMSAFDQRGRRIPRDVSIIGFDDVPVVEFVTPPLTTVRQDFRELGRLAARALDDLVQGRRPRGPRRVRAELILRSSCAAPRS